MSGASDPEEAAWAAFDAALRAVPAPAPPASLRERCLPGGEATEVEPPEAESLPRRRVLVVDDEPNIRRLLEFHLLQAGYAVDTARDGWEALEQVRSRRPDLVLLDVMMPKLDGFEVAQRLRRDPRTSSSSIIMLTAKTDSADVVAGLDAGAEEYLGKPVDGMALVARVRSMLRIKALHDTVEAQGAELAEWNRALEMRVSA